MISSLSLTSIFPELTTPTPPSSLLSQSASSPSPPFAPYSSSSSSLPTCPALSSSLQISPSSVPATSRQFQISAKAAARRLDAYCCYRNRPSAPDHNVTLSPRQDYNVCSFLCLTRYMAACLLFFCVLSLILSVGVF